MQRKYNTSLCHSNVLCAWIFDITYSTLSVISQDIGQVAATKERAKEMAEKKNISEWGMTGMVDRVFSVERRWLKTEGNPYVWKHGWRKKGKEITIVLLSDFNTRTNKHQSKCKWTKQVRVLHYTHLTTERSATKHCSKELQEFLEGKTTNF